MNEESLKQPSPLREVDSCTSGDTCLPYSMEGEIFNAKAYEKACARILRWTREKPTQPGWYWFRVKCRPVMPAQIVWVSKEDNIFYTGALGIGRIQKGYGEWAGPVPEPEEGT